MLDTIFFLPFFCTKKEISQIPEKDRYTIFKESSFLLIYYILSFYRR